MGMTLEEYERIQPNATVDGLIFNLPNRHCEWRVQTIYTKEPDTVKWIQDMPVGDVFYDIGANIGLYTMLAVKRGLRVFSFEPESQNFAILIRNLAMNHFTREQVVAFPFCISDREMVETLRLSSLIAGGSCHSFASNMNFKLEEKQWAYEQGSVSFSLDTLVYELNMPQPAHIKIDVDGFEDKVLKGAERVLDHTQSVLVEMDSANRFHMEWKENLENHGFLTDEAEFMSARRKEGAFTGIGNIIFRRPVGMLESGVSHDASETDARSDIVQT